MVTTDTRALGHILQRSDIYQKPYPMRFALEKILGAGLIVAEGDAHRRQRKVLNPAFGPSQLRALTDVMLDKANEVSCD
jgi:cytochrome P450